MLVELLGTPQRDPSEIDYSDITAATVVSAGPVEDLGGAYMVEFDSDLTPDQVVQVQERALTSDIEDQIRRKLMKAIGVNNNYLGLSSPTGAQTTTQVQRLTREVNGLMKLLLKQTNDLTGT